MGLSHDCHKPMGQGWHPSPWVTGEALQSTWKGGVTAYRSMGLLGWRGRAFWDGSRFTIGFVAERPKAGKGRDEGFWGRNKDGEKKRGWSAANRCQVSTCLAIPCRYLLSQGLSCLLIKVFSWVRGSLCWVHGDVKWQSMEKGLQVTGACRS